VTPNVRLVSLRHFGAHKLRALLTVAAIALGLLVGAPPVVPTSVRMFTLRAAPLRLLGPLGTPATRT